MLKYTNHTIFKIKKMKEQETLKQILEEIKSNRQNIKKYINKDKELYPSEYIQLELVKYDSEIIEHLVVFGENEILHPSLKVQEEAVSKNGYTIKYLIDKKNNIYPSEHIQYEAFKMFKVNNEVNCIKNPSFLQQDLIPKFEERYSKDL